MTRAGAGWPLARMADDGYRFTDDGYERVWEVLPGAIVVSSGDVVRLAPGSPAEWIVRGRGGGGGIAVAMTTPVTFKSMDVQTFLMANPGFLNGQIVARGKVTWQVKTDHAGLQLTSLDGAVTEDADPVAVVEANLSQFRDRMVLLVDAG